MNFFKALSERRSVEETAARYAGYRDLLFELSSSFINIPVEGIEEAIGEALARVAALSEADHAYFFAYDAATGMASLGHHWSADGIYPNGHEAAPAFRADIPGWLVPHMPGQGASAADLLVGAPEEMRNLFAAHYVNCLVALPLMGKKECLGYIGFGSKKQNRICNPEEERQLSLFANLVVNLLERKRIDVSLRESEGRFRALFEQISNVAVQGYNRHRQVIFWNRASEELYGYTADEALGRQLEDLIIPVPMREGVVAGVDAWVNGGPAIPPGELTLCGKNGLPVPVYSSHVVLHSSAGEPEMYCVDVGLAEQKRSAAELELYRLHLERLVAERTRELAIAKEAAETANLAKSKFLAASSHDLRQPLMAISLFVDALSRTPMNENQQRFTGHLKNSVKSLGEMLNTLLNIARLDSGAIEATFAPLRSTDLCRWLDNEFANMFMARKLRFNLCFPHREMIFETDADLLKAMLRNILDNALKFCRQGGVLVAVRRQRGKALIQVWDTGYGIAPEHIDDIFKEYYQIGNEERDRSKGVGLGLSIVMRQAHLIGAELRCKSKVGKGTVFEIVLPLVAPGDEAPEEPPAPAEESEFDVTALVGRRIVIVEDDRQVGEAMTQSLCALGMWVSVFGNADVALADPEIAHADLYISDFRLPGSLNGMQFLEAVEQRAGGPIKAILLTGETSNEQVEAFKSSPWTVLLKPVSMAELLAAFFRLPAH
ncbi:MAG: ATP-binding protein [Betaproteobacteria bacterium]